MPAPVLREIEQLLSSGAKVESASLRHDKLLTTLANATKRGEIEAVAAAHKNYARRIPPIAPPGAVTLYAKLAARLIINQAGGILENAGLSLHPYFNDPIIPGSAVKGVARHAAWYEWNEETDPAKKEQIARDIATLFGFPTGDKSLDSFLGKLGFSDAAAGAIAFLPAIPDNKPSLVTNITNSHHSKYYSGKTPVALDNEEPNPQFFPAVDADAIFRFTLIPLKPGANLDAAQRWLLTALTLHGAGAKTAAGYGWFENVTAELAERKKRETERLAAEEAQKAEAQCREQELARRREQEQQLASLPPEAQEDFKLRQITGDWGRLKQHLTNFPKHSAAEQAAIVRWLASDEGAARWQEIKTEAGKGKKPWSQIIGAIHAAKKQHNIPLP